MMRSDPALAQSKSGNSQRVAGSGPRQTPSSGTRARPRALIVDDDEDVRELYAWCLRAAGWIVEAVANGEEVLFVAPAFAPHVIVMDLRLPVIGGLEASRRLKANPVTTHIPIVAISGADPVQAEALAKEAGCKEFVAKPYPSERLRALLEDLVTGRTDSSA
jgi:two-component system cell cycle response regulator DivK